MSWIIKCLNRLHYDTNNRLYVYATLSSHYRFKNASCLKLYKTSFVDGIVMLAFLFKEYTYVLKSIFSKSPLRLRRVLQILVIQFFNTYVRSSKILLMTRVRLAYKICFISFGDQAFNMKNSLLFTSFLFEQILQKNNN